MAVRLFIGNLPYGASEADLRAHFAAVAAPSHVVMPVDRETGRPRGFAFVEFTDRAQAEEVIRKFDAQPFQGRNLAVSEARAREDRPPSSRPPGARLRRSAARRVQRSAAGRRRLRRRRVHPASRLAEAFRPALADAIARRTSVRPRRPNACAARRRARSRNTSRAARSRKRAADASTRWTTSRTIRRSTSTTSRRRRLPTRPKIWLPKDDESGETATIRLR